jgi:hypothetical protein
MKHSMQHIVHFEILEDHRLQIDFDDGKQETIDFSPILKGPLFGPLQDSKLFTQVQIDPVAGTLVWPNGADFDPDTLYHWDRAGPELEARLGTG